MKKISCISLVIAILIIGTTFVQASPQQCITSNSHYVFENHTHNNHSINTLLSSHHKMIIDDSPNEIIVDDSSDEIVVDGLPDEIIIHDSSADNDFIDYNSHNYNFLYYFFSASTLRLAIYIFMTLNITRTIIMAIFAIIVIVFFKIKNDSKANL